MANSLLANVWALTLSAHIASGAAIQSTIQNHIAGSAAKGPRPRGQNNLLNLQLACRACATPPNFCQRTRVRGPRLAPPPVRCSTAQKWLQRSGIGIPSGPPDVTSKTPSKPRRTTHGLGGLRCMPEAMDSVLAAVSQPCSQWLPEVLPAILARPT